MGSLDHSLSKLILYGTLRADGENPGKYVQGQDDGVASEIGSGGGSGGTVLLFVHNLVLGDTGTISTSGGHGSHNSGGGGGGRVHFHWSDIFIGEEYLPVALVKGTINLRFVSNLLCDFTILSISAQSSVDFDLTSFSNYGSASL